MENRKITEIKSYFFEINTTDRSLARMIRGKKGQRVPKPDLTDNHVPTKRLPGHRRLHC